MRCWCGETRMSQAARIRLADDGDAEAIAAIYRPYVEGTPISFETVAPDGREMARRIHENERRYPWVVFDRNGRVGGYAYASAHRARHAYRWSVDVSVYVDADVQRRGIGRGLYVSLLALLTAQGFQNAFAGIALPNRASVALHEALGFTHLGTYRRVGHKLGAWHDVGWWQLALGAHDASPREPLDLTVLRASREWSALIARGESSIRPPG